MLEVVDSRAFSKKLGIRNDCELCVRTSIPDYLRDLITRSDRNCGFGNNYCMTIDDFCDLARSTINIAQISMAVAPA
jgi:hypothetical protein